MREGEREREVTFDTVQSNFKGLRSTRWRRIFSERKQDGGKEGERKGQLEKARDIYTTNRNLPEVPLYSSLLLSLYLHLRRLLSINFKDSRIEREI